jgi:hypothetical protein
MVAISCACWCGLIVGWCCCRCCCCAICTDSCCSYVGHDVSVLQVVVTERNPARMLLLELLFQNNDLQAAHSSTWQWRYSLQKNTVSR